MIRTARVGAVGVLVLGLIGSGFLATPTAADAAGRTRVLTASGADVSRLLHPARSRAPIWRADRVLGSTITTRFAVPTRVNGTRIRAAGTQQRLSAARLEFSDGSTLAVRLDARGDRALSFSPRTVRWVRLVASTARPGQKAVALSGWALRRGASSSLLAARSVAKPTSVSVSSGTKHGTRWTASSRGAGQWMQLRWKRAAEVSAVRIYGGAESEPTTIRTGTLRFSDGSSVIVRALEPKGGAPTTIAFTPRITSWVRFTATSVAGNDVAAVRSMRVYPVGAVPAEPAVATKTFAGSWSSARNCAGVAATGSSASLKVLCPTNGSRVGTTLRLVLAGPPNATVTVRGWQPRGTGGSVAVVATGQLDAGGTARIAVPTRRLLRGPAALRVTATGVTTPLYVQFVNSSGVAQQIRASPVTRGMDLKFADTFSGRLSATRSGAAAVYASGKPNYYGVDDFGEAIFAQPDGTAGTSAAMPGGYLRIPARALPKGGSDPAGYGRTSSAGLLSSAHAGGSGFSAQYGYFEARMLAPAGAGTWPAFWMLSSGSLVGGGSTAEVDAVELYGNDTHVAFQTSHSWIPGRPTGSSVAPAVPGSGDWALNWHTYGARVAPTGVDYYIDGVKTGHTPPVVHADQPFFFLVNLALTAKWRSGLAGAGGRADLYVDSIRVWV